jgi:anti-anti-sigma regulatory factor
MMLRVEFDQDGNSSLTVRLQGKLIGPYAEDARIKLARYQDSGSIMVDLSEVTFVDPYGERVLLWLGRLGAKFVAVNVYTRGVCERLQLQVSDRPIPGTVVEMGG